MEHIYSREKNLFRHLKKNKRIKSGIEKKISHLIKERSNLLSIMEQKAVSMQNFNNGKFRAELHNLTTIIRV